MLPRTFFVAILATFAAATAASGAPPAGGSSVRISVSAGLAGAGRLGRWMPVDVDVENTGGDIDGTLLISWGQTRVERLVTIAAPSRRTFHLFIRTGDVRDTLTAAIRTADRELVSVSTPVRVIGNDETFTLCVAGAQASADICSAALPRDAMPRTWRGYDTADRVVADRSGLDRDQRDALQLWRATRAAEERGGTARPALTMREQSRWHDARAMLGGYALALALIAVPPWRSRRFGAIAAVALLAAAISAAAAAYGRGSSVVIRHATVVNEFANTPGALVNVAAIAEFPSEGDYAITPSIADGAMNAGPAYGAPSPLRFDADGAPLLAGRFGLASQQPLQLEATAPSILDVVQKGTRMRLTNVSSFDLRHCVLPASFTPRSIDALAPQQTVETEGSGIDDDPVLRCDVASPVVTFSDPGHHVESVGTTTLTYDFAREGASE